MCKGSGEVRQTVAAERLAGDAIDKARSDYVSSPSGAKPFDILSELAKPRNYLARLLLEGGG